MIGRPDRLASRRAGPRHAAAAGLLLMTAAGVAPAAAATRIEAASSRASTPWPTALSPSGWRAPGPGTSGRGAHRCRGPLHHRIDQDAGPDRSLYLVARGHRRGEPRRRRDPRWADHGARRDAAAARDDQRNHHNRHRLDPRPGHDGGGLRGPRSRSDRCRQRAEPSTWRAAAMARSSRIRPTARRRGPWRSSPRSRMPSPAAPRRSRAPPAPAYAPAQGPPATHPRIRSARRRRSWAIPATSRNTCSRSSTPSPRRRCSSGRTPTCPTSPSRRRLDLPLKYTAAA